MKKNILLLVCICFSICSFGQIKEKEMKRFSLQEQTGNYEIQAGLVAKISVKNDSLFVFQSWNKRSYTITTTAINTFEIPGNKIIQFVFSDLKNGKTQILTIIHEGTETIAKRIDKVTSKKN